MKENKNLIGISPLNKGEKIMFYGFIVAAILDLISTMYFVIKGYADYEINVLIYHFGWIFGGCISLLMNIFVLWYIIHILQKDRKKPIQRFSGISIVLLIIVFRFFVVINNFYLGSQPIVEPVVKPSINDVTWAWTIMIGMLVVYSLLNYFSFFIFSKDYDIAEKK